MSTFPNSKNDAAATFLSSTVVQGPSLLQTGLHRPSPSLMHLPGLRSLPLWTSYDANSNTNRVAYQDPMVTHVVEYLESHVSVFQQEYKRVSGTIPSDYTTTTSTTSSSSSASTTASSPSTSSTAAEHSLHSGSWDWHSYLRKGQIRPDFVKDFPESSKILQGLRDELFEGTPFGYCFFSTLHPSSSIRPHTGPINFRLRVHLPLSVPSSESVGLRVGPSTTTWREGKALVLDDSYEHEAFNRTEETRVVLLVDVWHPDVTVQERHEIVRMFQHAKQQGWLKSNG